MEKYRSVKYPPSVFWEVTERCNHNCLHCFNYWRTDKDLCIRGNSAEDYIAVAKKLVDLKPVKVILTGGEPLTVFSELKAAVELLLQNHITVSVNTNAALLTDEIAEYFSRNRITMFVSFPSCVPDEFDKIVDRAGAFEKVKAALSIAVKHRLMFSFNIVVSRINLQSTFETAEYLKDKYQIHNLSVTRVSMPLNAREHFDEYMLTKDEFAELSSIYVRICNELGLSVKPASVITPCSITDREAYNLLITNGSGCEAGKTSFVISAGNKVRACARDSKEYGDFLSEPFPIIWDRMDEWRDDTFIPSECMTCKRKSFCRGGCRIDSIVNMGDRNGLDCYSDPRAISVDYPKAPYSLPDWDLQTAFLIPENTSFCEEDFAVRVSLFGRHIYCTRRYADFLEAQTGHIFTVNDFCDYFKVDRNTAIGLLFQLTENGMAKRV